MLALSMYDVASHLSATTLMWYGISTRIRRTLFAGLTVQMAPPVKLHKCKSFISKS